MTAAAATLTAPHTLARQTPAIVPALLREYGAATRVAVEQALSSVAAAPYLGALVTDYPRRRGKMMRPSICIAERSTPIASSIM